MTRQLFVVLTILSASMSHWATAHHSRSNFSDDKITVEGVVVNGRPDKNPDRRYIFGDWMIKKDTGERYAINGPGARSTSEPPRYTLEDDGNRLNVVTTNEDPEYLAESIAQEHDLRRTDATLVDYGECDPEIAQRYTRPN